MIWTIIGVVLVSAALIVNVGVWGEVLLQRRRLKQISDDLEFLDGRVDREIKARASQSGIAAKAKTTELLSEAKMLLQTPQNKFR